MTENFCLGVFFYLHIRKNQVFLVCLFFLLKMKNIKIKKVLFVAVIAFWSDLGDGAL